MTIEQYLQNISKRYKTGISREHSYRGDLQTLLESLLNNTLVTNEPARIKCGAPDYILTRQNIPVGYIEAKDMGDPDLEGKNKNKEQFNRYKESLPNLIFTDYLNFRLYRDGDFITAIRIADIEDGTITPQPENFDEFRDLITDFATQTSQTIRSASKLSKMMAGKARLLATIIENALQSDEAAGDRVTESANTTLREQLQAFQNVLIHDIDAKEFADIYAQTIAYGMFAARLSDTTLDTFSRHEAAELIPKTNPFLRKLFQYIAGYDLDDRITWVVDALADIFRATDVAALLQDFGKATQQNDPIIHFYETFLAEFDPALRKSRGVWYTPEPVVNFIVRAVDDILKDEFGLKDGLADTSKTTVKVNTDVKDKRSSTGYKQEEKEVHKVQILDPAAGTGTFLAEAIKQIYANFEGQQGLWPSYVENHLIPRLNGFELLMASYAMAHLKLDMLLRETGYDREADQRFRVYLTNSLEEHHPDTGTLFAGWLSNEANEANHVKRDTPVMVVMGNPPYAVSSSNKGEWIQNLIADYKKDLKEKKLNLDDDYIKFIRYGQHFVEKNGEGVLAYISNNSFLDGITHRQMRKHLLKTFDQIYILNLHGNSNIKEKTPDGGKDENVFDIRQGVSINLLIKTSDSNKLADIKYSDLFGLREKKYDSLLENSLENVDWKTLDYEEPYFFFTIKDFEFGRKYKKGFELNKLFKVSNSGIKTDRDSLFIDKSKEILNNRIQKLLNKNFDNIFKKKFRVKNSGSYKLLEVIEKYDFSSKFLNEIEYRPFDTRWIYYDPNVISRPASRAMKHLLNYDNPSLSLKRQSKYDFSYAFIHKGLCESCLFESAYANNKEFPLYLYPEDDGQQTLSGRPERKPNLDSKMVQEIADGLGLQFVPEPEEGDRRGAVSSETAPRDDNFGKNESVIVPSNREQSPNADKEAFAPIDLLDYIYAGLHSPSYRDKYKEFLKIDFPRVPYPTDAETFWQLVELGGELRQIHLLEHPVVEDFITTYPEAGSNEITYRLTKTQPGFIPDKETEMKNGDRHVAGAPRDDNQVVGKVWINEKQFFGNVPEKAWNFYIGGYQPAEKWLKDRRDRTLSIEEIQHYQKIIVALMETDRIMGEIDGIEIE